MGWILIFSVSIAFSSPIKVYSFNCRYAFSEDASEEFDKDDTLTLIKPSPMLSKDIRSTPESRPVPGSNGVSNDGLEEDKTE